MQPFKYAHIFLSLLLLTATAMIGTAQETAYLFFNPEPADAGTISCVDDAGNAHGDFTEIAIGTHVTITVTPNEGYKISHIQTRLNGVTTEYSDADGSLATLLQGKTFATIAITIEGKTIINATFVEGTPVPQDHAITISRPAEEQGRISVIDFGSKSDIVSGTRVSHGDIIEVTAFEYEGYELQELHIGNRILTRSDLNMADHATAGIQHEVTEDTEIRAVYTQKAENMSITYDVPPAGEGTLQILSSNGTPLKNGATCLSGERITVIATPAKGYLVESITINTFFLTGSNLIPLEGGGKSVQQTVTEDTHISVQFIPTAPPAYAISFSWPAEVADFVTVTCNGTSIASGAEAREGDQIRCTFIENDNYAVDHWAVNGHNQAMGKSELSISMPNEDIRIELFVKEAKYYKVSYKCNDEGGMLMVTANDRVIDSGEKLLQGTEISFVAQPYKDYKIDTWLHNGEAVNGTRDSYLVILSYDIDLELRFAKTGAVPAMSADEPFAPRYVASESAWQIAGRPVQWTLYDTTGLCLATGFSALVPASHLPQGTYILAAGGQNYKVFKP